jgi:uncharacterized sporulation protein YeaH/YhbH (DUF444 family)
MATAVARVRQRQVVVVLTAEPEERVARGLCVAGMSCNIYVFYASDGANFRHDRENAQAALSELGGIVNYIGYVETASSAQQSLGTETSALFDQLKEETGAAGSFALSTSESVFDAIRAFFSEQAAAEV